MLSSKEKNLKHNTTTTTTNGNKRRSPSSPSSPSSSSTSKSSSKSTLVTQSSSSSISRPTPTTPTTKTMEEVWKDINLSSFQPYSSSSSHSHSHSHSHSSRSDDLSLSNFRGMNLQDFLARPFSTSSTTTTVSASLSSAGNNFLIGSPILIPSPPPHHLTLNLQQTCSNPPASLFNGGPLDSSLGFPSLGKKRLPESDNNDTGGGGGGDRRHRRMIKNRESAARSRARKQAYTNELELEVQSLLEENAKLKREQEKLCMAAAAAQVTKKHTLHRTSTAPF